MGKLTQDRKRRQERLLEDAKNDIGAKLFVGIGVVWGCASAGSAWGAHAMSYEPGWDVLAFLMGLQFLLGLTLGGCAVRYYTTELRRQAEDAEAELADLVAEQNREREERVRRCPDSLFVLYMALRQADAFVGRASHISGMITEVSESPTRKDIFRINNAIRDLPVVFKERHRSLLEAIVPILQSQGNMGDLNKIEYDPPEPAA